jgi:hypothetical protein
MANKKKKKKPSASGHAGGGGGGGGTSSSGAATATAAAAAAEVRQEIAEEVLALAAIYGDDFQLDADGLGFALRVTPHPGDAAASFTGATLRIR